MADSHGVLTCALLVLSSINVVLHALGTSLLVSLYRTCQYKEQQVYLIHLSISECLINLLEVLRISIDLLKLTGEARSITEEVRYYTLILSFTGISIVYYCDMMYLTLDKLMDIVLNIKYSLYWNVRRARLLLTMTWVIGLSSSVVVSVCHYYFKFDWKSAFFVYFYPIIEFAFILLAVVTYGFIFRKYTQAHRRIPGVSGVSLNLTNSRYNASAWQLFRRSRFYIPVLLIVTFLVFFVVPDLTYLFIGIIQNKRSKLLLTICWICYAISNIIDAYIYIFVQKSVRKALFNKLPFCKKCFDKFRRSDIDEGRGLRYSKPCTDIEVVHGGNAILDENGKHKEDISMQPMMR